MATKMRRPLSAQIEKNIFHGGPAGVTKQQGRAELLVTHKAFCSNGESNSALACHFIIWSMIQGPRRVWSCMKVKLLPSEKTFMQPSPGVPNVIRSFFILALPVSFQVKALSADWRIWSPPYIQGCCPSAVALELVPMSPACAWSSWPRPSRSPGLLTALCNQTKQTSSTYTSRVANRPD